MQVFPTILPEVKIIRPRRFRDARGWFAEVWNERRFAELGIDAAFVQLNIAGNDAAGTIRGLHFQRPPSAQGKLVWVVEGSILDVAVDLRRGSPRFGRHAAVPLNADEGDLLWVPEGFAHGYCTTSPRTRVVYKVTQFYDPQAEAGVRFDDPALQIDWPVEEGRATIAPRDRDLPLLKDLVPAFDYGAEA